MRTGLLALVLCGLIAAPAAAQFKEDEPFEAKPGDAPVKQWKVGMAIAAEGSPFQRIVGTTTVPMDWPEQKVRVVEEDLSPGVSISYQNFEGTGRQMLVKVRSLGANEEAHAVLTFEIKRSLPPGPQQTAGLAIPDAKKLDRKLSVHLSPSPQIESNHPDVKKLAEQLTRSKTTAWEKVEALYDWTRKHVEFKDNRGQTPKGTLETLNDEVGDCDEMCSVFIALCRALGVPARMVRVPGHVFAEFCLVNAEGRPEWFPCQLAGTRGFGGIVDPRPILQKGDNILATDPQSHKKARFRFMPDSLAGLPAIPSGQLKLKLICEPAK